MDLHIQPVERQSISEEVADRLRSLILSGELAPGDKLPAERELAERFGTNRNTLREAIRILDAQGLVAVRQGAASEVLDFRRAANLMLIPYYLREVGISREMVAVVRDLFALRRHFVEIMAAEAAGRANAENSERIGRIVRAIGETVDDTTIALTLDMEFYAAIIEATGSLVNRWLFNTFVPIYKFLIENAPPGWGYPDSYHAGITRVAKAIADGKPRLATKAIGEHLEVMDKMVLSFLQSITRKEAASR